MDERHSSNELTVCEVLLSNKDLGCWVVTIVWSKDSLMSQVQNKAFFNLSSEKWPASITNTRVRNQYSRKAMEAARVYRVCINSTRPNICCNLSRSNVMFGKVLCWLKDWFISRAQWNEWVIVWSVSLGKAMFDWMIFWSISLSEVIFV